MKTTDFWPIIRLISLIVYVPGIMAGVSIVVAFAAGDMTAVLGFTVTAAFAIGLGSAFYWLLPAGHQPNFRETMVGCAGGWLVAALVGAGPFMIVAYWAPAGEADAVNLFRHFWNAFFESMSGFTTTGLTLVERPSQLPVSLQWWRSFTQWIGGLGMIVLVLAMVRPGVELSKLFRAEGHERAFGQSVVETVRETWWIYLVFTLLGIVLLRFLGMTLWESINHAMTAVSTGGFTVTDNSLSGYGNGVRAGVMLLTILGAISFIWHQYLLKRNWSKCRSDVQTLTLLVVLAGGTCLLAMTHLANGHPAELPTIALHWSAAVTTSGFSSVELEEWSDAAKMLLILAMVVGGCTGSAAGGIKLLRVATLFRELMVFLRTVVLKPWLLVFRPATLAGELDAELVGRFTVAGLLVVLWFGIVASAGYVVALLAGPEVALNEVMFDVTSALSITGLSTGVASSDLGASGRAVFILLMWMGRLEILPVLVFFAWLSRIKSNGDGTVGSG